MGIDTDWTRFLAHPAYFLNLDRRPDRLARTAQALAAAGFTNQHRFAAVDGKTADLPAAFASSARALPLVRRRKTGVRGPNARDAARPTRVERVLADLDVQHLCSAAG